MWEDSSAASLLQATRSVSVCVCTTSPDLSSDLLRNTVKTVPCTCMYVCTMLSGGWIAYTPRTTSVVSSKGRVALRLHEQIDLYLSTLL